MTDLINTLFVEEQIIYDGSNLRSLYAYRKFDVIGDSIIAFIGPCHVKEHLVDLEDRKNNDFISADAMVHFIVEHFGITLSEMVCRQRLLIAIIRDYLGASISRQGDDLFLGKGKLSVSIATISPVSALIHTGVNVTNEGTPIQTASLQDLNVTPEIFARDILRLYREETEGINRARCKVEAVS